MKRLLKADSLMWIIIVSLIILFFGKLLFFNFAQDDFYCLTISKVNSLKDYLNFFTFEHSFITAHYNFYRPLTTQFYFAIVQNIFGLTPFYFHLISLILHLANTFLVYKTAKIFFSEKNKPSLIPLFAAIFFGLNQSQTITIGWASNIQELGVTFFVLLSVIFFYIFLKAAKKINLFISLLLFILALLSKETAIMLPFLLIALVALFSRKKNLVFVLPFLLILTYYLYNHFFKFHFSQTESYIFIFNVKQVINTLKWHVWWALGLPEMFLDYIGPRFSIIPRLWEMFFVESVTIFSLFITLNLSFLLSVLALIKNRPNVEELKKALFFALFYIIFLVPVLLLPDNKYPFHQTTSLVGFSLVSAFITSKIFQSKQKLLHLLSLLTIFSFVLLSFSSVQLTMRTHWLIGRARIVDSILKPFTKQYPAIPKNSIIYIKNDPNYPKINDQWGGTAKQSFIALSGPNSFRLLYNDNGIEVYYEGVPEKELPIDIDRSKLIEYTAQIPY